MYNPIYYHVMAIVSCDMQFKNTSVQCVLCWKLNKVMLKKVLLMQTSRVFMAKNVQAKLNVIQIMYDNRDPNEPMVNREEHVTSIRLNLWTYTQNNKSN